MYINEGKTEMKMDVEMKENDIEFDLHFENLLLSITKNFEDEKISNVSDLRKNARKFFPILKRFQQIVKDMKMIYFSIHSSMKMTGIDPMEGLSEMLERILENKLKEKKIDFDYFFDIMKEIFLFVGLCGVYDKNKNVYFNSEKCDEYFLHLLAGVPKMRLSRPTKLRYFPDMDLNEFLSKFVSYLKKVSSSVFKNEKIIVTYEEKDGEKKDYVGRVTTKKVNGISRLGVRFGKETINFDPFKDEWRPIDESEEFEVNKEEIKSIKIEEENENYLNKIYDELGIDDGEDIEITFLKSGLIYRASINEFFVTWIERKTNDSWEEVEDEKWTIETLLQHAKDGHIKIEKVDERIVHDVSNIMTGKRKNISPKKNWIVSESDKKWIRERNFEPVLSSVDEEYVYMMGEDEKKLKDLGLLDDEEVLKMNAATIQRERFSSKKYLERKLKEQINDNNDLIKMAEKRIENIEYFLRRVKSEDRKNNLSEEKNELENKIEELKKLIKMDTDELNVVTNLEKLDAYERESKENLIGFLTNESEMLELDEDEKKIQKKLILDQIDFKTESGFKESEFLDNALKKLVSEKFKRENKSAGKLLYLDFNIILAFIFENVTLVIDNIEVPMGQFINFEDDKSVRDLLVNFIFENSNAIIKKIGEHNTNHVKENDIIELLALDNNDNVEKIRGQVKSKEEKGKKVLQLKLDDGRLINYNPIFHIFRIVEFEHDENKKFNFNQNEVDIPRGKKEYPRNNVERSRNKMKIRIYNKN